MDARHLLPDAEKFQRKKPTFFCKTLNEYITPEDLPTLPMGDFLCVWAEAQDCLDTNHPDTVPGRFHTARCFVGMCKIIQEYKFGVAQAEKAEEAKKEEAA